VILVLATVALGALAQSVSGFGFGLVSGPFLVAALGPADGVRLALLLSLLVNVVVLLRHHEDLDRRAALLLLVPAALATPLVAWPLGLLPDRGAQGLAGGLAVLGAVVLSSGVRVRRATGPAGAVAAGVLSAAMNAAAAIGGPAVALWAENAGWSAERARGTLNAYFLGLNTVALLTLGLPSLSARDSGGVAVALAAGLVLGGWAARRVSPAGARRATFLLAGLGGLAVLLLAVLGV
jgi:uncharacterized membrane protein YfcA